MKQQWRIWIVSMLALLASGCGYNDIQRLDEQTKSAWGEVINQYQRRADLVPNLVNVVKGYATHEQDVLTQVADARSRAGSVQLTPDMLDDEQRFKQFQQAQSELSSALS